MIEYTGAARKWLGLQKKSATTVPKSQPATLILSAPLQGESNLAISAYTVNEFLSVEPSN
jgi:hypothetical protein